ncbi:hypothetical protein FB567DRAFT_617115 [Paraphoma chrysanthemicola]|uniref:Uncharacterized protein n=1 Tax=Paraphoma chrysanthemicola TaxID=798071 RepID=A0A8K0RFG0_9PLEO|nr:hypothetical protein FB567DRAFT_617115 [Paraphoma chrysanthemicola]
MSHYADRELTNPQDKLPAISGMAKILADSIGDAYFAGLWEGDLLRGLLWNVVVPRYRRLQALLVQLKLTRPMTGTYVAPSWSWASRDAVVSYRPLQSGYVRDYQPECSNWQASYDKDNLEKLELLLIASRLATSSDEDPSIALDSGEVSDSETDHYTISSEQQRKSTGGVTRDLSRLSVGHEVVGASECSSVEHDGDVHKRSDEKCYKDDSKVREAFGLLIYPAEEDGNYFRVGRFRCKVEEGGLSAFDDCPVRSVKII